MNYVDLMKKSEECTKKAITFSKKKDWRMAKFYANASEGYKQKAYNLIVS